MTTSPHGTTRARRTLRILQSRIASGEWPLNSKIPTEAQLVDELGVGRSTIREAVRTLANMGMLEPAPSRGTFVRSLVPVSGVLAEYMSGRTPRDLVTTRVALEVEAARLAAIAGGGLHLEALRAAHRADVDTRSGEDVMRGETPGQFHGLVLRAAESPLLIDLHSSVMSALRRAMSQGQVRSVIGAAERQADHARLLAAIEARDPDAAMVAARAHLEKDLVAVD